MTEEEAIRLFSLAATIIQAHVRGYLVRKKFDFCQYRRRKYAAASIQAVWYKNSLISFWSIILNRLSFLFPIASFPFPFTSHYLLFPPSYLWILSPLRAILASHFPSLPFSSHSIPIPSLFICLSSFLFTSAPCPFLSLCSYPSLPFLFSSVPVSLKFL